MVKIREDFKYKKIKNFFSEDEVKLLKTYCDIKSRISIENFDQGKDWGQGFYGDQIMESMLLNKKDFMSKECGIELLPTYSFWRLYTKFQYLPKHKDRPSCEISVTIMVGSDGTPWPIYMEDQPVNLEPGDACIYRGCELNHRREEFQGDWHSQIFLHYVDKKGPYADYKFDKRFRIV